MVVDSQRLFFDVFSYTLGVVLLCCTCVDDRAHCSVNVALLSFNLAHPCKNMRSCCGKVESRCLYSSDIFLTIHCECAVYASFLSWLNQRSQQFVRDNVLHVDGVGDEEVTAAQRGLRRYPVHEVVDRTLNDAKRDTVFETPVEEDDKVNPFFFVVFCMTKSWWQG